MLERGFPAANTPGLDQPTRGALRTPVRVCGSRRKSLGRCRWWGLVLGGNQGMERSTTLTRPLAYPMSSLKKDLEPKKENKTLNPIDPRP